MKTNSGYLIPLAIFVGVSGCQSRKFITSASSKSAEANSSEFALAEDGFPKCDAIRNDPVWTENLSISSPVDGLQAVSRCVANDIDFSDWDEYFAEYNKSHPDAKISPVKIGEGGREKPVACVYAGRFTKDDDGRKLKDKKAFVVKGQYQADFGGLNASLNRQKVGDDIRTLDFQFSAEAIPFAQRLLEFWETSGAFINPIKKDLYIGASYRTNGTGDRDRAQQAILSKDQGQLFFTENVINQPKETIGKKNGERSLAISFRCKKEKSFELLTPQ